MTVQINGESKTVADRLSLAELVTELGMKADRVAVELNLEIVARGNWDTVILKDGDKLEIVHFVGGGSGRNLARRPEEEQEAPAIQTGWSCPTCLAQNRGNFCTQCGEKRPSPHDLGIGHLLSHAAETLFHWDSKIFRTFRVLFSRPGLLSAEYAAGKRKAYVHPFQVFFIANVLYFLLFPILGWSGLKAPLPVYEKMMPYSTWATRLAEHRAAAKGISRAELIQRFDHVIDIQSRSMVLIMVPLFALAVAIVEWRKKRLAGEHLVFALHFIAVYLVLNFIVLGGGVTAVVSILRRWGITYSLGALNQFIGLADLMIFTVYLYFALRRFYGDGRILAGVKALLLSYASIQILELYRLILFVTSLYST